MTPTCTQVTKRTPISESAANQQTKEYRLRLLRAWLIIVLISVALGRSAPGAQFTVTTTADSGPGSLRQAIEDANNDFALDVIAFAIPSSGPQTISPRTALPQITAPVIIDGYSQPRAIGTNRLIHLDGANLRNGENGLSFGFGVNFSVVSGLVIERFPFAGIYLQSGENNDIFGNLIQSNLVMGVAMSSGIRNVVKDNVITGNGEGVFLFGVSHGNTISNNKIGIDEAGVRGPNGRGIDVECSSTNFVQDNFVFGNGEGIVIRAPGSEGNVIESNTTARNDGEGILLFNGPSHTTIRGNQVVSNKGSGVAIEGASCRDNLAESNTIYGNADGVLVSDGASATTLRNNLIINTVRNGVHVVGAGTTGVAILGNSIHGNSRLGIDLGGVCGVSGCTDDGITPNDPGDADSGPNNLQNFPVLTSVTSMAGCALVQGTLNSTPNTTFRLEFFANNGPTASYVQGETFLGFTNVTTSANGNASFAVIFQASMVNTQFITATATDPANNTSEFSAALPAGPMPTPQGYLKASNTEARDSFAYSVAVSGDTMVVGAPNESSSATGVNGNQSDNGAPSSGAAYVFVRNGTNWVQQQAYLKASNAEGGDYFGGSVAISGDTIVVGAWQEDSAAIGVNGSQGNNNAQGAGAAYVFVRNGTTWTQQAYLKASNTEANDLFGWSVAVSGNTIVVGAFEEDSNATGVNGNQGNNSAQEAGAAYVFVRNGTTWTQQAYLKASNARTSGWFGYSVAVAGDTIVVGAIGEASNATGVNGNQSDNSLLLAGAAYVFARNGTTWTQQAYLKASNTGTYDFFGRSVAVSGDTVVVGADGEYSNATQVNGDQSNNSAPYSGAAYVFARSGTNWSQQGYLKAFNTDAGDYFGHSVAVSGDTIVIGALAEDSNASGVNCNPNDNSATNSGAAYVFLRRGTNWSQQAYLKAVNAEANDSFGNSVAVSGETVVVGAQAESSNAIGVNGNQSDNSATFSGAAYVFTGLGSGPRLAATRDGVGGYFIRCAAHAGFSYRLQRAASVTGPWETRATLTVPASGLLEYHDTMPLPDHAFYRAVQP